MSSIKLIGRLRLGQGCEMLFKADESQPHDSIDYRCSEVAYDGKPDSWVPEIGAHWHKYHDEYMSVLSGRVEFTLDGKVVVLTPADEPIKIPRWHVHSFRFFKGEPAVFKEKTDPTGEFKMDFFEDLLDTGEINMLTAFRAFYNGDTYIALPFGVRAIDQLFTLGVGFATAWMFPQKNKGILAESVTKLPVDNAK